MTLVKTVMVLALGAIAWTAPTASAQNLTGAGRATILIGDGPSVVSVCQFPAFSTAPDPDGLNVHAGSGTEHPVIAILPSPREIEGETFATEVSVTGSRDGWFRLDYAFQNDYIWNDDVDVFKGEGWVSGRYLGLWVESPYLWTAPDRSSPIAIDFYERDRAEPGQERGMGLFELERLHACVGDWVDVKGTYHGRRIRGWTNDTCASQVTTCP